MQYEFRPNGVCSSKIVLDVGDDTVQQVQFVGGYSSDSQGTGVLVQGIKIDDMTRRLRGIRCGCRNTSRPDQLMQVLLLYQSKNGTKNQTLFIKGESADFRDEMMFDRETAREYLPYSWRG